MAGALASCGSSTPGESAAGIPLLAYEWRTPDAIPPGSFATLARRGYRGIYFDVSGWTDAAESPAPQRAAAIAAFGRRVDRLTTAAVAAGLQVHAVAGAPRWADDDHRYLAALVLDLVLDHQSHTDAAHRLRTLQFDIEPPQDSGYGERVVGLVRTVDSVVHRRDTRAATLPLEFAVPAGIARVRVGAIGATGAGLLGDHLRAARPRGLSPSW